MTRVIVQVPMDKKLRDSAQVVAEEYGFSSLQEAMRVIMTKLAKKDLDIHIGEKVEYLTPREEAVLEKRYKEFLEDEKKGNLKSYTSVDEMMKDLTS
ncbi:hypothetical protein A2803_02535 [Candidatus Woesebacteria bacterium RIFCSPHIGHO2_01_FULL_44_21]|uniref:Uncharacterized protein n=1 Tax=Candidatus Woesebacteria bacterium RIFCSPHIGHO2_01_FULL_44_21 TaxID=1802503 RepID=A0A1F7YVV3_9BACT|nr:MAG: hypothetical protein A2803_02535 [Candidatus Woesebacteria bacterium RIFCSPHIGHO2_01_FULL_44_21]OGM70459.1 MAG: hypothetical protein A2897_01720 [Candidatus Woesebacteria bacterium RIFCSPLOWO2_01_FULL_44_24b]